MLFSYKWLQSYIKDKLPQPSKLARLITYHSFEVEEIKKINQDYIFNIPVPPNRGDCLSYIGLAKECAALISSKLKSINWSSEFNAQSDKSFGADSFIRVSIKDRKGCLRYIAGVARGIRVHSSPLWLQRKLKESGLNSINNVVDITNYVMLETGQPLHVFDFDKIGSGERIKKLIIRKARKGERITTLDNKEYILDKNILVVADDKEPLSLAGIKGGEKAKVDSNTKNVVVESANFDPALIQSISNKLNLKTDASWRFEHGINIERPELAIKRAMVLIKKLCGGTFYRDLVDEGKQSSSLREIKLDISYACQLLGTKISKSDIIKILKRLNFKIIRQPKNSEGENNNFILVTVPADRLDILLPEDLIEEIGRMYGYDKIKEIFPKASLIPPERNDEVFIANIVKESLKNSGFFEVLNYSFINENDKDLYKYGDNLLIKVIHPISSEFKYLRPSLTPNLLKNVILNSKYFDTIKLFELGKIFFKTKKSKNGFIEKNILAGLISEKGDLSNPSLGEDIFYSLKGVIDAMLRRVGLLDVWYDDYQPIASENTASEWEINRSAEIKIGQDKIGFLGEISSDISRRLRLSHQVVMFCFDFDKIVKLANAENEYQPISPYPEVVRDISLIVPNNVKVVDILNKINLAGGRLVKDVDLFDIYQNDKVGENKKSLAFHIIYQAQDRTLTSAEVDKIQNRIIHSLENNSGWKVRK